ncbi:hypothetical protein NFI96_004076 [Prochilodus magdalenae]|nr:hypothetical protein NFI96_004076 [Prochilodus magdalenae]
MHRDDGNHRSYTDHQSSCSKSCTPSDLTNLTLGSVSRGNPLETWRRSYNSEISFHGFPVDPEVRARWLTQIHRDNFSPLQSTRVCSWHFNTGDFVVTAVGKRKLNRSGVLSFCLERLQHARTKA